MGGARKRNRPRAASSPLGSRTVATVGTVATKRRVGGLRPAEGDCPGPSQAAKRQKAYTQTAVLRHRQGKLANRGTPATCMAGSNSTSESGIAGDLLDAGISGREGQAPATRPSATMAASRSEYYGRAFTAISTLSRQYRQRQDTGVEQLGIKNDKQRSGNNRSAIRLAVLFGTVAGEIIIRPPSRRGKYFLSRLSWLWCCCCPQPLGNRVQHRHVLIPFGQLGSCIKRGLNDPLYLSVVGHAPAI